MIHLAPNTADQRAVFSPFQARKYLAAFTNYLLVVINLATKETFACVLDVEFDNERYTQATIGTNADDATNGDMLITESGLYSYTIYGQNSASNVDPTSADVVGSCEIGTLRITGEAAWNTPSINIPDNVIYYE